jgi:1-acyl-sn-glycerol-3-phosphate acyltransferase
MRYAYRYRVRNVAESRRRYQEICRQNPGPLIICANHLTLVDSFVVTWALGSEWWFLRHFSRYPWHVPERKNFANTWYDYLLTYMVKCAPVERGASRAEVSKLMGRLEYLLEEGQVVFLFPEATRSRTGRVQIDSPAHGVGRLINALPGCKAVMVYLRGDGQETWGDTPIRGDTFYVDVELVEFKSEQRGIRRSHDLAQQTVLHLQKMEERYFAARGK